MKFSDSKGKCRKGRGERTTKAQRTQRLGSRKGGGGKQRRRIRNQKDG